jgi:hypothetical protein
MAPPQKFFTEGNEDNEGFCGFRSHGVADKPFVDFAIFCKESLLWSAASLARPIRSEP